MSPYHHGDLKNALIETGLRMIHEQGLARFSMRKAAKECGVSAAALYSHFENTEALLEAMQKHVIARFTHELTDVVERLRNENKEYMMIQLGKRYITFFIENPHYYTFLFASLPVKIELTLQKKPDNFAPFSMFCDIAADILREMGVPEEMLIDKIIGLWALVHGVAQLATTKSVTFERNWEEEIENIIWNR